MESERGPSSSTKKLNVLLLSSEWWSRKGGISTLNRILALQLAKYSMVEVTVFLLECSEEEKREALKDNIRVVKATRQPGLEKHVWLCFPPNDFQIDIVIGHGAVLGAQAKIIRDSRQCKWVQVAHTAPKELAMFKTYPNPILRSEVKHQIEVELCEMADIVIGVGPKLSEAFRCYISWCKKNPDDVVTLTPGIFSEYSDIKHASRDGAKCRVLTYGRGDEEDFALKGFDIAAKAVAELSDTILIFAGARDEDLQHVTRRFLECSISPENLDVRGSLESKQDLIKLFCEADLALMPSRTEGFGLTALEALSAGLPVLVSRNTGFGEALSKLPFGSTYVVDSKDASVWATAIEEVWKKGRKRRLQESDYLRFFYRKEYNWESQCNDLVDKLLSVVDGEQRQRVTGIGENLNKKGTSYCELEERMESGLGTQFHGTPDDGCMCHTTTQQIADKEMIEEELPKHFQEEKTLRARRQVILNPDRDEAVERFGSERFASSMTHRHNLHIEETIVWEQLSLSKDESDQGTSLKDGRKILQVEVTEEINRCESTQGMQSTGSVVQEEVTTGLESEYFTGDFKDELQKKTTKVEEEFTQLRSSHHKVDERLENKPAQMHRKIDGNICLRHTGEDESREMKAIVDEMKRSLEEEQQIRRRVEEELRQTKTVCTEMEETIHELVQMCFTPKTENYGYTLIEQESEDNETIIFESQEMLGEEQEARTKVGEPELRQVRTAYNELKERFNALQQVCTSLELSERYVHNLRQQELREKEAHVGELQEALGKMEQAKRSMEQELSQAKTAGIELQQQLERGRYISTSREFRQDQLQLDWIIQREEISMSGKILGRGGWGTVTEGTFRGCQVAVKELHAMILSPLNRRMFEREMNIASRCHHPNLLQFIGATNDNGSPLLVSELLDFSLRHVLINQPLSLRETATIGLDIAKGLNYLHLKRPCAIMHRDVSSSNVLLWRRDDCWRAKLGDFGASNLMQKCMTVYPGAIIYSAPEAHTPKYSTKIDVYSFGVLLCEMCIRELPDPENFRDQILKVSCGAMRGLIQQCVSWVPTERPSMSEVICYVFRPSCRSGDRQSTQRLNVERQEFTPKKQLLERNGRFVTSALTREYETETVTGSHPLQRPLAKYLFKYHLRAGGSFTRTKRDPSSNNNRLCVGIRR